MSRAVLILILVAFTPWLQARELQNGLIIPVSEEAKKICCIMVSKDGFSLYDAPNGEKVGLLTQNVATNTGDQSPYRIFIARPETDPEEISRSNLKEVGYEVWGIQYFERKDGFVRGINKENSYWISEHELRQKGFEIQDWPAFFIEKTGLLLGFYANDPGLNLRSAPTTQGDIIKPLKGDLFEIEPTSERQGLWLKVKVKKYKEHPCSGAGTTKELLEYELTGWIKAVDDSGKPNLWYYSRGC